MCKFLFIREDRDFSYDPARSAPRARFSKVPIINGGPKAVVVYVQDRGFNSFESNMIKLSVNETKWSSCSPGPALLFFIFRFQYLISGPKSYQGIRETGPRLVCVLH